MVAWASKSLTAAALSDGRIQFWATDASGAIWSAWQTSYDWVYWQKPWTPALPTFSATNRSIRWFAVAAGSLLHSISQAML